MWPNGTDLFAEFSPELVLVELRRVLRELGVPEAEKYRSHDFRRGMAQDMKQEGYSINQILSAGGWSSALFSYLDRDELEDECVLETHVVDSSGDEAENSAEAILGAECTSRKRCHVTVPECPRGMSPDSGGDSAE